MSRILADKVTNYNNDGPFLAEQGIEFPVGKPLVAGGSNGGVGNYLASTGSGLAWTLFPDLFSGDYNDLENKPTLFSGSYLDLSNKPSILPYNLTIPTAGQILVYDDVNQNFRNSDLPPVYTYTLSEDQATGQDNTAILRLVDNFGSSSDIRFLGETNGITFNVGDGDIEFVLPTISEYDVDTTKDDMSAMFTDGTHTGITFTYNTITRTFDSEVQLAEQLTYNLSGNDVDDGNGGTEPNQVDVRLATGSTENGNVILKGTNGVEIDWNVGTSEIVFSKVDPPGYVLPTASTSVLGGVKVDGTTIQIDGSGAISATVDISNKIELTSLSVITNASASGEGSISYNNTTGEFQFTPAVVDLDTLTDVGISSLSSGQVLQYNGVNWQNVDSSTLATDLDGLTDVAVSGAVDGDYLYFNGTSWTSQQLTLSGSIHAFDDVAGDNTSNTDGMFLRWVGGETNAYQPTEVRIQDLNVNTPPGDGDILIWDDANSYWITGPQTGGGGGGATLLDDLSDVSTDGVSTGDILVYNGTVFTASAPGAASLPSRAERSISNNGIMNTGDSEDLDITNAFPGYNLYKINVNQAAWVTLYCDSASRTADASRTESQDPAPGSGVIAEAVTTASGDVLFTPAVAGFNNDSPAVGTIYMKIVNKAGNLNAGALTVTLTLLATES